MFSVFSTVLKWTVEQMIDFSSFLFSGGLDKDLEAFSGLHLSRVTIVILCIHSLLTYY